MNAISKKYEFTNETKQVGDVTLYRIRALRDFGDVKAGDLGGFIEKEDNLSHDGNCWVYDKARVFQNARVYENGKVKSFFVDVYGDAQIYGNAIFEGMTINDYCEVYGNAHIQDTVVIEGNAKIYDNASVSDNAYISDTSVICGDAHVGGYAIVGDGAYICDHSSVIDDAVVYDAVVSGYSCIHSNASLSFGDQIHDEAIPRFGSDDDYFCDEYEDVA
ncbi:MULTISPECIES: hypothetical protein [unclassified Bartonella]|uniref:hypothetical protein n=1 Tax=unclassified Bartonella TaxID=2645622 RepID=UPI0035CF2273